SFIVLGLSALHIGHHARFRKLGQWSASVAGLGFGLMYVATAYGFLHGFWSRELGFAMGGVVTVSALYSATSRARVSTALIALFGGFTTPLFFDPGLSQPALVFGWLFVLDLLAMSCAARRRWPLIGLLTFFATAAVALRWLVTSFGPGHRDLALVLIAAFEGLYLFWPLLRMRRSGEEGAPVLEVRALLILGAPAFALAQLFAHSLHRGWPLALGLGLSAAVRIGLAARIAAPELRRRLLGLGLALLVAAAPALGLGASLAAVWALVGLAFMVFASRFRDRDLVLRAAFLALGLGVVRALLLPVTPLSSDFPWLELQSWMRILVLCVPALVVVWKRAEIAKPLADGVFAGSALFVTASLGLALEQGLTLAGPVGLGLQSAGQAPFVRTLFWATFATGLGMLATLRSSRAVLLVSASATGLALLAGGAAVLMRTATESSLAWNLPFAAGLIALTSTLALRHRVAQVVTSTRVARDLRQVLAWLVFALGAALLSLEVWCFVTAREATLFAAQRAGIEALLLLWASIALLFGWCAQRPRFAELGAAWVLSSVVTLMVFLLSLGGRFDEVAPLFVSQAFMIRALALFALFCASMMVRGGLESWSRRFGLIASQIGLVLLLPAEIARWSGQVSVVLPVVGSVDGGLAGGMVSMFWAIQALTLVWCGFRLRSATARTLGLYLFGLVVAKVLLWDLDDLDRLPRILAFLSSGLALLWASFMYHRLVQRSAEN
ncbi:MAG: DUF2339 domain-containing protein, partial [Planctomycetes bacterium]|nr:DUF2339 domain-containing protein [Planctomycetota bacterium]